MARRFRAFFLLVCPLLTGAVALKAQAPDWLIPFREPARRLIGAAYERPFAWQRLAELTDTFGPRLSGSPGLEASIEWALGQMKRDGLENVRAEPVTVPRWVRGEESLEVVSPSARPLAMLGLGGSVATPPAGVEAELLVVRSFTDLDRRADRVKGRIVLFNAPFTSYGETVNYRTAGASRAAQYGAVGMLVRAVGPIGLRTPHTGAMRYADDQPRIPAASVSAEDAEALQRLQDRGVTARLRLTMSARMLPDAQSANVVGEIVGRERPDEVVVVGGHLDSWDVGTGASDDGVGCIITWEAVRLMKVLGLKPRRTVRVVLFTNEENGIRGGLAYRDAHREELARHVAMLESDSGVFPPVAIGLSGNIRARETMQQVVSSLLEGLGVDRLAPQGGGADIGPSVEAASIPSLSLNGNAERYFVVHHTAADTVDRIDPADVSRAVAAVAVVTYVLAEMPQRLGSAAESTAGGR